MALLRWTLICLSLVGFVCTTVRADPEQEETVRAQVAAARQKVADAERDAEAKAQALDEAIDRLRKAEADVQRVAAEVHKVERRMVAQENAAEHAVRHIDEQIEHYRRRLAAQENAAGGEVDADQIAETKRYIRAYENMKRSRLKRIGATDERAHLMAEHGTLREALRLAQAQLETMKQRARQARARFDHAVEAKTVAFGELWAARQAGAEQLADVAPPILERVKVTGDAGETTYEAEWRPAVEQVDKQIELLEKALGEQDKIIELRRQRVAEISDLLAEQLDETNRLLDEYIELVGGEDVGFLYGGKAVWAKIGVELGHSATTVAMDFKTFGPWALLPELGSRLWDVGRGNVGSEYDLTNMPGLPGSDPHQASDVWRYGQAGGRELITSTIKKTLESYATGTFGVMGEGMQYEAGAWGNEGAIRGLRNAVNEGRLWMVVEKEVLGDEAIEIMARVAPGEGLEGYTRWLQQSPRRGLQQLKAQLLNKEFGKDFAKSLLVTAGAEYLKGEIDDWRMDAWNRYIMADTVREAMTRNLKFEGKLRDLHMNVRDAMDTAMADLLERREQAEVYRQLVVSTDEQAVGTTAQVTLTFSAPVKQVRVRVAETPVDGEIDGETWTGRFELTDLPDRAPLTVEALGELTEKALDDPATVARFATGNGEWAQYEPGPDQRHRLHLKPVRPGVSMVLLIDCSGSMRENDRMPQAKTAAAEALEQLGPDDEVALIAFFDCSNIQTIVPFTTDRAALRDGISRLEPSSGTPLAASIRMAGDYLYHTGARQKRVMVVLTDGDESCGGNTMEAVRDVRQLRERVLRRIVE
ncbi:MAG: VWA domain-containing protein [Phycisphaeraceae bacterium]